MSKTVLITGASGGIGGACVRLFAASGYKVAVHYNSDEVAANKLVGVEIVKTIVVPKKLVNFVVKK